MSDLKNLTEQMGNLREEDVLASISHMIDTEAEQPQDILNALSDGMDIVGQKFDTLEYFVGELIYAGVIFTESLELLRPVFHSALDIGSSERRKVILATVEGDLHDIGKNIVKVTLESKGLQVIDLGVNISPAAIVKRTVEENASIVALSGVMICGVDSMQRTVEAFTAAGIREKVKIIIGGCCANESIAKEIKADFYAKTPDETAALCLSL